MLIRLTLSIEDINLLPLTLGPYAQCNCGSCPDQTKELGIEFSSTIDILTKAPAVRYRNTRIEVNSCELFFCSLLNNKTESRRLLLVESVLQE